MKLVFIARALACAVIPCVTVPAEARFLQVDPVGYKDQFNLYAYVGDDPINSVDPTGLTCDQTQNGQYTCHIDQVRVKDSNGNWTTRASTAQENRRFASFNARYTAAVNRLGSHPDRMVTVKPVQGRQGSFQISGKQALQSLVSRQFVYAPPGSGMQQGVALSTSGVYNPSSGQVEGARTFVSQNGLDATQSQIVHDGGLHATPQEYTGGLQNPSYPLAHIPHEQQYNSAACGLLGGPCGP